MPTKAHRCLVACLTEMAHKFGQEQVASQYPFARHLIVLPGHMLQTATHMLHLYEEEGLSNAIYSTTKRFTQCYLESNSCAAHHIIARLAVCANIFKLLEVGAAQIHRHPCCH